MNAVLEPKILPIRKTRYVYKNQTTEVIVLNVPAHVRTDYQGQEHETFSVNTAERLYDLVGEALQSDKPFMQLEYSEGNK